MMNSDIDMTNRPSTKNLGEGPTSLADLHAGFREVGDCGDFFCSWFVFLLSLRICSVFVTSTMCSLMLSCQLFVVNSVQFSNWSRCFVCFLLGTSNTVPPDWYDEERFLRVNAFFRQHAATLVVCWYCSLTIGFSLPALLGALVFTGNSSTPPECVKRYTATFQHLMDWHLGNIFDSTSKAWKSVNAVRGMHEMVRTDINGISFFFSHNATQCTCKMIFHLESCSFQVLFHARPIHLSLQCAFVVFVYCHHRYWNNWHNSACVHVWGDCVYGVWTHGGCSNLQLEKCEKFIYRMGWITQAASLCCLSGNLPPGSCPGGGLWMSQYNMACVQSGFMGLLTTHSDKLG